MPFLTILKKTSIFIFFLFLLWLGGAFLFVQKITQPREKLPPHFDAIIVLTGGSMRIEAALDLFLEYPGKKLYISGVHPTTQLRSWLTTYGISDQEIKKAITIDIKAKNTEENAQFAIEWIKKNQFKNIVLLTANYHMPRSLVEFKARASQIHFIPYPIAPETVLLDHWWRWSGTRALIISEYNKFLIAKVRSWHF